MQLTIRMPDNQMGKIEHIAKKMGLKKSDVTRMALKKFIEEYSGSRMKQFDKVKNLLGVVESGVPDLGQRHRNHLIKKIKGTGSTQWPAEGLSLMCAFSLNENVKLLILQRGIIDRKFNITIGTSVMGFGL